MKSIIVTGANSGIGKAAALMFAEEGHHVIMVCRDSQKSKEAHQDVMLQSSNQNVSLITADLSQPQQIKMAAEQIKKQNRSIDVLVNNAGVYKVKRSETLDGIEMTFAVNFLATVTLSQLLLDELGTSGHGRIINVISELYKNGSIDFSNLMLKSKYSAGTAYANAKLASALFTIELAKQTQDRNITVNALHPGVLATNAFRDYPQIFVKLLNLFLEKPKRGGERIVHLALSDQVHTVSGKYFYKDQQRDFEIDPTTEAQTQQLLDIAQALINPEQ